MKHALQKLFSPLLGRLESGDKPFLYKPSHRIILLIMSVVFFGLGIAVFFIAPGKELSYLIPVILFGGGGLLGFVVGFLGSNRAVAKVWGSG